MDILMNVGRGLLGMITLIAIAYAFSNNKKHINWKTVGVGLAIQLVFALLIFHVPAVATVFKYVGKAFNEVIGFTQEGVSFLFRTFDTGQIDNANINFAITILPTIIFFSALTSFLFYIGLLQKIVFVFAWVMKKLMGLSGAESLAAAGNVFLGQTESPLLVKPYIKDMTNSELMCLMGGGMATIAGGVLAAYIKFLGGGIEAQEIYYAKHLLAASIMSAPAAIVAAKILYPETEKFNEKLEIPKEKIGDNAVEAITNGTLEGLKLAVNVGAMLLVFIAFIAFANAIFELIGRIGDLNGIIADATAYDGLSLQFILGYACAPLTWLLGVHSDDIVRVGQLLGEKTILNEFYAYMSLGNMKSGGLLVHEKSIVMATYILCGFANFASIGIQVGGIGSLAPERRGTLAKMGFRSLIAGTLACLFTAVVAGMVYVGS